MQESIADKKLTQAIYDYPDTVARLLRDNGYYLPETLTLQNITEAAFHAVYSERDVKFAEAVDALIENQGFLNFAGLVIAGVSSIASIAVGARQAKKARELQLKIALAQLAQAKELQLEEIRTNAETERTRILINSLQQYQSDLQGQSTQRLKDVWVYIAAMAVGMAIIYATVYLVKKS